MLIDREINALCYSYNVATTNPTFILLLQDEQVKRINALYARSLVFVLLIIVRSILFERYVRLGSIFIFIFKMKISCMYLVSEVR